MLPALRSLTILIALTALLPALPVAAQNALGSGNALDASTRVGSGGANPRARDYAAELRYRNAIITGNAPGGYSFRGNIGYTAPGDFRGRLGSDDLYTFRRDTFLSSITSAGGQALRSADALQYQMQLGISGQSALGISPIVSRSPSAGSGRLTRGSTSLDPGGSLSYDPFQTRPGALRATSSFITGDALSPVVIDTRIGDDGRPTYTVASPLGAIRKQTDFTSYRSPNLLSPRDEPEDALDSPGSTNRVEQQPAETILDRLRQRLAQQDAGTLPGTQRESLEDRLDRIRQVIEPLTRPDRDLDEETRDAADSLRTNDPFRVQTLVNPAQDRESLFRTHMQTGQELLGDNRWFQAEERFAAALRMIPGDTLAAAGKAHAQLGAGLLRSASISLRRLFKDHPELMSVLYDSTLLPGERRLESLYTTLRERSEGDSVHDRDAAFLMAYLGWQKNQIDIMAQAFVQIDRINGELGNRDPVYEIARELWLPEEQD